MNKYISKNRSAKTSVKELSKRVHSIAKQNEMLNEEIKKTSSMAEDINSIKKQLRTLTKALSQNPSLIQSEQELLKIISENMPYITVDIFSPSANRYFHFLFRSNDPYMAKHMWGVNRKVHSEEEIRTFLMLSQRYYGITPDSKGSFLDIGGNIGTTSIYVSKCCPALDVLAFEPDPDNSKIFRINCILNNSNAALYNIALGERNTDVSLALSDNNMGDHRILNASLEARRKKTVCMRTFDTWLEEHPQTIKYIWMDVQGYEGFVLEGMQKALDMQTSPIWMEFCPQMLRESGSFESLLFVLQRYFSSYIDRHNPNKEHTIDKIIELADSLTGDKATDLFLIRKGISVHQSAE